MTFCIATEYAIQNPNELVVVADICPQSNVSEMLLGGNGIGGENCKKLYDMGCTVAGYIKERFLKSRYEKLGTESEYFTKVAEYNPNIPPNLYLLCGDVDLDLYSILISTIEKEPLKEATHRAMALLKDALLSFESLSAHRNKKITTFIDCNPSFAVYTELAIFASDRLIVPCTGDFASLRGLENVLRILYGIGGENDKTTLFNIANFAEKAKTVRLMLPEVFLGVINRSRTKDQKVTIAYKAHVKQIMKSFASLENPVPVVNIKDCNNISLVVNHIGMPVSKLEHKKYDVYGEQTQINETQLVPLRQNIDELMGILK